MFFKSVYMETEKREMLEEGFQYLGTRSNTNGRAQQWQFKIIFVTARPDIITNKKSDICRQNWPLII
uniref:Uncharacterized protein n=1 Tax=Romanomermis culicivorax TaxID=13658 RepID=A0A915JFY0_ROMCU